MPSVPESRVPRGTRAPEGGWVGIPWGAARALRMRANLACNASRSLRMCQKLR